MRFTPKRPIHPAIREAASEVLLAAGRQSSLEVVVSLLDDPNRRVKKNALTALATYGQDVPLSVIARFSRNADEYFWIRQVAVQTLGAIGTEVAIQIVLEHAAREDENVWVRSTALNVLGERIEHPSNEMFAVVLATLRTQLKVLQGALRQNETAYDSPYRVATAAGETLACWVTYLVPDVELIQDLTQCATGSYSEVDPGVRDAAASILSGLKEDFGQVEALLALMRDASDSERQALAVYLLGRVKTHVPPEPLLHALYKDVRIDVRWAAARALGARCALGDLSREVLEEHLVPLLDDEEQGWSALGGLAALGFDAPPIAKENIIAALRGDHTRARGDAIRWLSQWPIDQLPVEDLVQALKDDSGTWCTEIVEVLSKLGKRIPVNTFVAVLADTDPNSNVNYDTPSGARVRAAYALGELGARAPVEALIQAAQLEDTFENSYIRAEALKALGKLGDQAPVDIVAAALGDENNVVRTGAAKACMRLGERAPVDALLAVVGDYSLDVREAALNTLKQIAPDALRLVLREAEAILRGDEQAAHYLAPLLGKLTI